ncbi:hypothetical protein ACFX1T_018068 [Malus domestica]
MGLYEQQQYVGFSQMHHHHSQSITIPPSATANYAYEYANPQHEQVFYTQHQATPLLPQYQPWTSDQPQPSSSSSTSRAQLLEAA